MARKIEPYKPPSSVIAPHPSDAWSLDASEQHVYDSYAQEHVNTHGTWVDFYSLSFKNSKRDPLYSEINEHAFAGPYRVKVYVSYPDNSVNAGDSGASGTFSGTIWFPRKSLEDANAPIPAEGDVFHMWNIPYWDGSAVLTDDVIDPLKIPGSGLYCNITNVDEDGVMFDNPNFVGVSAEYSRTTTFAPERRLGDDK